MSDHDKIIWWREKPVWVMLFLGFSAGIPILLIFSSLSLWLTEAGVKKSAVTYFSWAALAYSFKFIWAPLVDKLPLPLLSTWLGRRRGWLLFAQLAVIGSIIWMGSTDPQYSLTAMAIATIALGFSSATQDVVIDAFRIESANPRLQAMLSSTYVAGYRTGMIVAGAGALFLAESLGSIQGSYSYQAWRWTYYCMAAVMSVGIVTTLLISEPDTSNSGDNYPYSAVDYTRFLAVFVLSLLVLVGVFLIVPSTPQFFDGYAQTLFAFLFAAVKFCVALVVAFLSARLCLRLGFVNAQMVHEGYVAPITDFFKRYGRLAIWVLMLVGFYRVSDIVMGIITNVFYADMGYTKTQIASITKAFGVIVTIAGSFLGGILALKIGVMRVLMLGAILVAFTNLLFVWLAGVEPKTTYLALVIIADNLAQGVAIAAFIAWLSSLTNISFTATQYAIFSSLMTLFPKLLGGYSGTMVEAIGYSQFFLFASLLGVPVIVLIYFLQKKLINEETKI